MKDGNPENPFVVSNDHAFDFNWEPSNNIVLGNGDKQAIINFGGDSVTYSGNLPVEESARLFFDAVMAHWRNT